MSDSRPLVAVAASRLGPGRVATWTDSAEAAPGNYLRGLRRAGALTVTVGGDAADVDDVLARVDGLVLLGGADLDPALYDQSPHPSTYGTDDERDSFEVAAARRAVATELPLLAVCRGVQVLNVALGGSLHQHLPDLGVGEAHGVPVGEGEWAIHPVEVAPGSRLAAIEADGGRLERCVSIHHQSVDAVAPGLQVTATAPDGVVEALETASGDGWCVGVQWHPERSAATDPAQQALFDAFVDACR